MKTLPLAQSTLRVVPGRALAIDSSGSLYTSKGYDVYRSDDDGFTWTLDCRVPCPRLRAAGARFELVARLLRHNVQALQVLRDGSRVAVARDGIYRANRGETDMNRTWAVTRGSRPINLAADGERLLFGEYGGPEMDAVGVRVYCSEDGGRHFDVAFEFRKGEVHHVHNVVVDNFAGHYWLLAGDHGSTPGIGALARDLRHLDWIARGTQMARAVSALVRHDRLIYGTDSELEPNFIVELDKKTGHLHRVMPLEGSSLYAADFGMLAMITTSVEPSRVNRTAESSVYCSDATQNWSRILRFRKDLWHPVLFQFGTVVLPYVQLAHPRIAMFSGQALAGNHDRTSLLRLHWDETESPTSAARNGRMF